MIDFMERSIVFILAIAIPYVIISFAAQDVWWPYLTWELSDPLMRAGSAAAMIGWVCSALGCCYLSGRHMDVAGYLDGCGINDR